MRLAQLGAYALFALTSLVSGSATRRDGLSAKAGDDLISTLTNGLENLLTGNSNKQGLDLLSAIQIKLNDPNTKGASDVQDAFQKISSIFTNNTQDILGLGKEIVASDLLSLDILNLINGFLDFKLNSPDNNNPAPAGLNIYPTKETGDAPYSVDEGHLRSAIYIPDSFSWGKNGKKPVILVPGTGVPAGLNYYFNFGKLGEAMPEADVVWVNIPRASLDDAQVNAEYVAYAVNYISGISNTNVSILSWSQGGIDTQWALKYWPSTRKPVEDFIAMSPDFRGTVMGTLVCPTLDPVICTPSFWQQRWESKTIKTLRDNGGDSAYVPTTTIYSSFDEIVEPMSGPDASAILNDARGVGVTNNHIQTVCGLKPGGTLYTHEGVLYNPLSWALAVDALQHDGPGNPSRLDLDRVCNQLLAPQLGLDDLLGTEGILLVAVAELVAYLPKAFAEPPIKAYAHGGAA